jgi:putative nucleotidyltransferase with HDIG domain
VISTRTKNLVLIGLALGAGAFWIALHSVSSHWLFFSLCLAGVLLSSGMKVPMLKSEGTMSVNFPFILLGIVQLSPAQAVALAVCSVIVQCNFRVMKGFTLVQIAFNLANVTTSTVLASLSFAAVDRTSLGFAPAVAAAGSVYFLTNTFPVATILASETAQSPLLVWRKEFFWFFPFYLAGAFITAAAALLSRHFGWATAMLLIPLVFTIYRTYNEHIGSQKAKDQHIRETEELHLRTIESLAMAIEAKDQGTHRHLQRVRVYVSEIGRIMGLNSDMMRALLTAAFLHDIGKLAVPERILNKPGKLTKEEFDQMKIHPGVGADILERVRFPYPVVPIVRSHHEAWDGSGYPDGLKGEEIPLGARILSVVDCFDAIASDRPYRKALPPTDALAIVKSKAGIQFDPAIVELLETHLFHLEEQAALQMDGVAPLNTHILVERGAMPGAGFQVEHQETESPATRGKSGIAHQGETSEITLAELEAQRLFRLSQEYGSALSTRDFCALMACRLSDLVPYDCFAVYLKEKEMLLLAHKQGSGSSAYSSDPIKIGAGISGWVAATELACVNGNPTVEPTYTSEHNSRFTERSSALSIPLFGDTGSLLGVLSLYSAAEAAFSKHHLHILQTVQSNFSLALQASQRAMPANGSLTPDADGLGAADRGVCPETFSPQGNAIVVVEDLVPACPVS